MTDITIKQGNDLRVIVQVQDQTGTPVDISGAQEITWAVATGVEAQSSLLTKTLTGSEISITNDTGFFFDIEATDSDTLGSGAYYHEALLITGDGKAYTTLTGSLTIQPAHLIDTSGGE